MSSDRKELDQQVYVPVITLCVDRDEVKTFMCGVFRNKLDALHALVKGMCESEYISISEDDLEEINSDPEHGYTYFEGLADVTEEQVPEILCKHVKTEEDLEDILSEHGNGEDFRYTYKIHVTYVK
jgi:hypothetical protein